MRFKVAACLPPFLALIAWPLPSSSQEQLEEIIVTADFRSRSAEQIPVSMTALDAAEIAATSLQHFEELIYRVPNLNWSGDGNRARYLQIRGVGELEQYEGAPNPSVGFLIDDIDFSGIGSVATLFDIDRVEVLRGPQGTRYGANALAGLVYVQSTEAGAGPARLELDVGDDDLAAAGVAVGGSAGAADYRLSLHHHDSDGFRRNVYLGRDDTNGRRETTARARLAWQGGDEWHFRLAALYADLDNGYDAFALDNGLIVRSDRPGRDAQESRGVSLRAERPLGGDRELTSITSWADSAIDFSFDADWGNPASWAPFVYDFVSATARERQTISQEFRLVSTADDGSGYTIGVYGLALDERLDSINRGVYEDFVVYGFADALDERFDSRFEALNAAVFGEKTFAIGTGLLSAGVRIEHRTTDYADSDGLTVDPSETMVGGELAWLQPLGDDANGYVSLSRGYKAGGFNLGVAPPGRREFGQEVLWNLEAGLKADWLDGRLSLDAAVFVSRRADQQVRVSEQLTPGDPASFVFFTDNAARGRLAGLETDITLRLGGGIELYAALGLLDTEFDRFDGDERLEGRAQAHAPSYSATLGGYWQHERGFFAGLDVSARDAFYFDVSHDQRGRPFELVNLRVGYAAEHWSLSLWARNLLDEDYAVRGFYFGNEPPDFPSTLYTRRGDPRQLGLTFKLTFAEDPS